MKRKRTNKNKGIRASKGVRVLSDAEAKAEINRLKGKCARAEKASAEKEAQAEGLGVQLRAMDAGWNADEAEALARYRVANDRRR